MALLDPVSVSVYERNDPLVTFTIQNRNLITGVKTPYDLTGSTLECYVKTSPTTADTIIIAKYVSGSGCTITDAVNGVLTVQFLSTDATLAPGTYFYRIDALKTSRRNTLAQGPFIVVNI